MRSLPPLWKKRSFRIALVLGIVGAVFLWLSRGPSELDRYRAQLISQGEVLALSEIAPKRSNESSDPDTALAALTNHWDRWSKPMVKIIGLYEWRPAAPGQLRLTSTVAQAAGSPTNRIAFWQGIATAVSGDRTELSFLRDAVRAPARDSGHDYNQFWDYTAGRWLRLRSYAQFCHIAAISDIHAAAPEESFATTISLMNLAEFRCEEWFIVAQMARLSRVDMARTATWYGLETHLWDEPKLAELQARWDRVSLVTNFYQSVLIERAGVNEVFAYTRMDHERIQTQIINHAYRPTPSQQELFWQWWRLRSDLSADQLFYLKNQQAQIEIWREQLRNPSWARAMTEFRSVEAARQQALTNSFFPNKYLLSEHLGFSHEQIAACMTGAETLRLQTIAAIALERHRLKYGQHPEALADLVPDFLDHLPRDPLDGRPLRYRLNADGSFTLWSVGLDGKDNGGDPTMPSAYKPAFTLDARDILWPRVDPIDLPTK